MTRLYEPKAWNQATYVLVHGAWHGSWCWKRIRKHLQDVGHQVFTPTLTGLGERSHLNSPAVNLSVHISRLHRQALKSTRDNETAITNVFTGRPARATTNRFMREVGPMSDIAPEFPLAAAAVAPLRAKSETAGSADFTPLWSGQSARLGRELPAADLTKQLAAEALGNLR